MNVGIYVGAEVPENGGSFAFIGAVLDALDECESRHSLRLLRGGTPGSPRRRIPATHIVTSRSLGRRFVNRLQRRLGFGDRREAHVVAQIDALDLQLVWFLTPLSLSPRVPYVATVWDLAHRVEPAFPEVQNSGWPWESREAQYAKALPRATYVVVGHGSLGEDVSRCYGVSPARIRVLPLVAPNRRGSASSAAKEADPRPYLFYPAQFWPHKNHVGLLHALKKVRGTHGIDVRLVLSGADKGNLAHVRDVAAELDLLPHVSFEGFVSDDRLGALYAGALAMVFPSFFGPDNLPPIEAMQVGCPVIAANVPGALDQLGDAALLVNPRDATDIASAIVRLVQDSALRATLSARGQARAAAWTPRDYALGMLRVLDEFESERRCWGSTIPLASS